MIFIFLAIIFAIIAGISYYKERKIEDGIITLILILMGCLIITSIITVTCLYKQIWDLEDVTKFKEIKEVYVIKSNELITEFKSHLIVTYPAYEKEIFDKIKPSNVEVYLAKFPELKTSETILELIKQIRNLKNDVYKQDINIAEKKKNIRFRLRNPLNITFLMPKLKE